MSSQKSSAKKVCKDTFNKYHRTRFNYADIAGYKLSHCLRRKRHDRLEARIRIMEKDYKALLLRPENYVQVRFPQNPGATDIKSASLLQELMIKMTEGAANC